MKKSEKLINNLLRCLCLACIIMMVTALFSRLMAQEGVYIQSSIDGKMLVKGDQNNDIDKGTIDISARFIMEGKQQKHGYVIIFPEFTYRNTKGNLKSWTANIGYNFNNLIIPRSEVGFTAGWGWLDHYGMTYWSWVTTQSYGFKLSDGLKLVAISEFRERSDWPDKKIGWSVRVGFEVKLF